MKLKSEETVRELLGALERTRVFLSMPYISGVTPVCMERPGLRSFQDASCGLERRDGIFRLNEASLSPLDHGNLYGDAVFEGIRIDGRRILLFKEHVDRWLASAARLGLEFPYSREELCKIMLRLCRESLGSEGTGGYFRPVLSRGIGNLGVSPVKCVASTLYIVFSSVLLYPKEHYEYGIDVAIARHMRRNDPHHLDPNIKTNNYLNNVLALLETEKTGALETLMLTNDGYVAEATADNIFVAEMIDNHPVLKVPAARYALIGLTRNLVIDTARRLGFEVIEDDAMLPTDFIGQHREVFITGTACGLMPVTRIDGLETAPVGSRPLTDSIRKAIWKRGQEDGTSISMDADDDTLDAYLSSPSVLMP